MKSSLALILLSLATPALAAEPVAHQDMPAYLTRLDRGTARAHAWRDAVRTMNSQFDMLCGDTFCEREFWNLVPMQFTCSVETGTGKVKDCLWTFAGSENEVNPVTGENRLAAAKFFDCRIRIDATAEELFQTLQAAKRTAPAIGPLHTELPGGEKPIFDQLSACL